MKQLLLRILLLLTTATSISSPLFSQVLSYEKLKTFSIEALDSLIDELGILPGIIVPEYEVDYYKVTYLTPYLHPDSLVQASGAIAFPKNYGCEFPLTAYGHGTQSERARAASSMNGGQWDVNTLFASTGYVVAMPDYLGLGDSDPKVIIHPYTHAFSQSNTTINMLRAARSIADSINVGLNYQVFLYGYSQGGGSTVATVKEIETNHPFEFDIAASAPMSGAYDLKVAQVDLIVSDSVYPTPGYLPYILLAYQSIYGNLFGDVSSVMKDPYDSIIPPLFYDGLTDIGSINSLCPAVPKQLIIDSIIQAFQADSMHPIRINLLENDLIHGWFPQNAMRLLYCKGDDQVTYLNSENAFDAWTALGSQNLEKVDFGNYTHNDCALFAFINAKYYFDQKRTTCPTSIEEHGTEKELSIFPNPAVDYVKIQFPFETSKAYDLKIINLINNQLEVSFEVSHTYKNELLLDVSKIKSGAYIVIINTANESFTSKMIIMNQAYK